MAPSKKSPPKTAKLDALKVRTVRLSVAARVRGGVEPSNDLKRPKSAK